MFLDLSILKKPSELNSEAIIEIEPLAPLSMIQELPGSYYKTLKAPSKKMICGLFENVLGWHIDLVDRKEIIKELKKERKKQKLEFVEEATGSTYIPLLMEYFEIKLELLPAHVYYDDYWNRAYRRPDATVHPKGTFNISHELIPKKTSLEKNEKALESFFKENIDAYPLYYSTPTSREYIFLDGKYQFKIQIDISLYNLLRKTLRETNIAYLGNSEGWVDIKLYKI